MKVATLFMDKALEALVLQAMSSDGIEATSSDSITGMLAKCEQLAAIVIEDDDRWLTESLLTLCPHKGPSVPVFVVGSKVDADVSQALLQGATDYLLRNEVPLKLVPRLRARLHARGGAVKDGLHVGSYMLSENGPMVSCGNVRVRLTPREFALAWVLFSHVGRVVSLDTLAARVWGRSGDLCKRTLEQHVYRLRRKLGGGTDTVQIRAVYNVGYRLEMFPGLRAEVATMAAPMAMAASGNAHDDWADEEQVFDEEPSIAECCATS